MRKMFERSPKNTLPDFEKTESPFQNKKQDELLKPFWEKKQNSDLLQKCKYNSK
jgi:hypothetical protein